MESIFPDKTPIREDSVIDKVDIDEEDEATGYKPAPYELKIKNLYSKILEHEHEEDLTELEFDFINFKELALFGVFGITEEFDELGIFDIIMKYVFNDDNIELTTRAVDVLLSFTLLKTDELTKRIATEEIMCRIFELAQLPNVELVCVSYDLLESVCSCNDETNYLISNGVDFNLIFENLLDDECPHIVKVEAAKFLSVLCSKQVPSELNELVAKGITSCIVKYSYDNKGDEENNSINDFLIELMSALSKLNIIYKNCFDVAYDNGFLGIDYLSIPRDFRCYTFYLGYVAMAISTKEYEANVEMLIYFLDFEENMVVANAISALLYACDDDKHGEEYIALMIERNVIQKVFSFISITDNFKYIEFAVRLFAKLIAECSFDVVKEYIDQKFVETLVQILIDTEEQNYEVTICSILIQMILCETATGDNNVSQCCIDNDIISSIKEKHDEPSQILIAAVDKLEELMNSDSSE